MHPRSVGSYEAKTHLPALLDAVLAGEHIVITRKGMPVAMLTPYETPEKQSIEDGISALLNFRATANLHLKGLSIRDMREEGQR